MNVKQILKAHLKELLNQEVLLHEQRMKICKACPLYDIGSFGPICNPALYLNPTTNEFNHIGGSGFTKGCGCRLNAKTRDEDAHCPNEKW